MPSFRQRINQKQQFIIGVHAFTPFTDEVDQAQALQTARPYPALVDTGATRCCISEKIVRDLNLQPHSQITMETAGHPISAQVYFIGIVVSVVETVSQHETQPDGSTSVTLTPVAQAQRGSPQMRVTALPDIDAERGFEIILGMDMLNNFHITLHDGDIIISI